MTRLVWLDQQTYTIRVINGDPATRQPYLGVGTLHVFGDVAIVTGLKGDIKRSDVRSFYNQLRELGVCWLLGERVGGGRFPKSIPVPACGPFAGWQMVDLRRCGGSSVGESHCPG